ncbi:MAG: YdeI/OmpD-associated family protein [Acidobacteriota bacterium]
MPGKPRFFRSQKLFRDWLEKNHETAEELVVGYWKVATGKPCMTWSESVDQALCFGWIDGIRHRLDDESYTIRFTPRRRGSNWSDVNLRKVEVLRAEGRMAPAGLAAWEERVVARPGRNDDEGEPLAELEKKLRASGAAWAFFNELPPSQRKLVRRWLASAKKEETRQRRLEKAAASFERGERLW